MPQGGPLSAILFTIYTDEIRSNSHISVTKYADDTAVSCKISKNSVETDQLSYQCSVNDIVSICNRKNLLLNPKKSKEMCFANKNIKHDGLISSKSQPVVINGSEVVKTPKTDYLGVLIDEGLTFSCHVSKVLSKVYYIVSSLAYVVSFFNQNARENVSTTILFYLM